MCDPISLTAMAASAMSAIGTAGTAVAGASGMAAAASGAGSIGTMLQAASAIGGGLSAFQAAQYQGQIAKANQAEAMREAGEGVRAANQAEDTSRQKTAQVMGAQQAQMAANGLDLSSGSAAQVLGDTARAGNQDALTIRQNYYDRIRGYANDANNFAIEGAAAKAKGIDALGSSFLNAGSSILGGSSSLATKWNSFKQMGLPVPKGG